MRIEEFLTDINGRRDTGISNTTQVDLHRLVLSYQSREDGSSSDPFPAEMQSVAVELIFRIGSEGVLIPHFDSPPWKYSYLSDIVVKIIEYENELESITVSTNVSAESNCLHQLRRAPDGRSHILWHKANPIAVVPLTVNNALYVDQVMSRQPNWADYSAPLDRVLSKISAVKNSNPLLPTADFVNGLVVPLNCHPAVVFRPDPIDALLDARRFSITNWSSRLVEWVGQLPQTDIVRLLGTQPGSEIVTLFNSAATIIELINRCETVHIIQPSMRCEGMCNWIAANTNVSKTEVKVLNVRRKLSAVPRVAIIPYSELYDATKIVNKHIPTAPHAVILGNKFYSEASHLARHVWYGGCGVSTLVHADLKTLMEET